MLRLRRCLLRLEGLTLSKRRLRRSLHGRSALNWKPTKFHFGRYLLQPSAFGAEEQGYKRRDRGKAGHSTRQRRHSDRELFCSVMVRIFISDCE